MSAPLCTISVDGVSFSDFPYSRLQLVALLTARAEQKPDAGSHHEQNRNLAERVEGAVSQQNPGDDVGSAELAWNEIHVSRRQLRKQTALTIVVGDGREDDAEQGD